MKKIYCLALCTALLSLASYGHAMPGMDGNAPGKANTDTKTATEKYEKMDTNNSGNVNIKEFTAAYPHMTEAVFGIINKDGKEGISLDEWLAFQSSHMQGMKHEKEMKKQKTDKAPMLITPPKPEEK